MSLLMSLCAVLFTRDVVDEIWDLIGSVSAGFPTYFFIADSLILSYAHYPDITEILLKRASNCKPSIHSSILLLWFLMLFLCFFVSDKPTLWPPLHMPTLLLVMFPASYDVL